MLNNKKFYMSLLLLIGVIMFSPNSSIHFATNGSHPLEDKTTSLLSGFIPFLSLLMLIGGSIIVTLLYVGWRKYKGSQSREKIKKHKSNY